MKTIISSLHFEWRDLDDCFQKTVNTLRVDGVELSFHQSLTRPHCTKEELSSIRRVNEKYGLDLYAHIWEDLATLGEAKATEALRYWMRICVEAGIHGIVIHGGSFHDRDEGIARTYRTFESLLPDFEKTGVVLYLENHYAYDYRDCRELFSEVWEFDKVLSIDSPSLRFCLDTGHANMTGNTRELFVDLQSYLSHVHIADNHGVNDDHCHYKEGNVDWDMVWRTLRDIDFDGTFCAEFPVRDNLSPFQQFMEDRNIQD